MKKVFGIVGLVVLTGVIYFGFLFASEIKNLFTDTPTSEPTQDVPTVDVPIEDEENQGGEEAEFKIELSDSQLIF